MRNGQSVSHTPPKRKATFHETGRGQCLLLPSSRPYRRLRRWKPTLRLPTTGAQRLEVARATRRFSGWTPSSPAKPRPSPLNTPSASPTVGHPAFGTPIELPCGTPSAQAGRLTPRRVPDRCAVWGGALPPLRHQAVGGPDFAGAKSDLWRPQPLADRVGTVQLAGLRLDAWPHVLRRGSHKMSDSTSHLLAGVRNVTFPPLSLQADSSK